MAVRLPFAMLGNTFEKALGVGVLKGFLNNAVHPVVKTTSSLQYL